KLNDKAKEAFQSLKRRILEEPILIEEDPDLPYKVETDASDFAIGGQLGQRDSERRLHPVAFFSKKLYRPELNYQIHDKELIVIIKAFKEWRSYLSGANHQVQVYTDHKNLIYFITTKELNKRQIRWAEFLSEYDVKILYKKGSENGRADALSRRADHEQRIDSTIQAILRSNEDGIMTLNTTYRMKPDGSWEQRIKDALPMDEWFQEQQAEDPETDHARYQDKTYVPEALRKELIQQIHENPMAGHQGIAKTKQRIQRYYGFPELAKLV